MKTIIEIWTSDDLSGIEGLGIQQVWTEIDEGGRVLREIGLGESGEVVYVAPSNHSKYGRGLFDNQIVSLRSGRGDDSSLRKRFESLWISDRKISRTGKEIAMNRPGFTGDSNS